MKGRAIPYSKTELEWLSNNRTLPISDFHSQFCKEFNRADVEAKHLHALRKRKGWKTGRSGCFTKGNKPHNANSAGTGLMKQNKTSFKKGNKPHNWRPVGSTRISKDGYIEVKIQEPRTWAQLHTIIWIAANGPIPKANCVVFKDFDKTNVKLDNLELVTRNENLQINRLKASAQAKEVRPVVRTIGKIKAKQIELSGNTG